MKHYIVYFRDRTNPREVFASRYQPEGSTYVFYNPSGYGFLTIEMFRIERIEEVE